MGAITVDNQINAISSNQISDHIPGLTDDILQRMSSILALLCIPRHVRPQCITLFRVFLQRMKQLLDQPTDRPRLETAITACALLTARSHQLPISISDAAAWARIEASLLHTTYQQIGQVLSSDLDIRFCHPSIYFDRILQAMRYRSDPNIVDIATRLLQVCSQELILLGRPIPNIAAALIAVALRAIHRQPMTCDQISRIESELNVLSFRTEIDLVLTSLSRLASLLPFHIPFGPDSLDLYLPEIVYDIDQLTSIASSDVVSTRLSYTFVKATDVLNRIEVAKAVIRVCRRRPPGALYTGELPIDIYSEQLTSRVESAKTHLDGTVEALFQKSVPIVSILNGDYRLCL